MSADRWVPTTDDAPGDTPRRSAFRGTGCRRPAASWAATLLLVLLAAPVSGSSPRPESRGGEPGGEGLLPGHGAPKRIVICMDGTWNNPAKLKERDDGDKVFKPTNVLKTCRAVKDLDDVTATLTLSGQPLDGETVTIDGKIYTFQAELTEADGHVGIGKETRKSLENLLFAINKRPHRSARYADATREHPSVRARPVAGDRRSIELVAKAVPGSGDPFSTAETLSRGEWLTKSALAAEFRRRGLDPRRGIPQITYYDLGVGAERKFPGFSNRVHRGIDKLFGGAAGAGFESNIEDAYTFLSLNYRQGDQIFLFGFSRGASSARGLSRFIDWMGGILPAKDAYWIPRYFDSFLGGSGFAETRREIFDERVRRRLDDGLSPEKARERATRIVGTITPARVHFLGVWDTVLALGKKRERPHVQELPAAAVLHARQALAIDERRAAFRPRVWTGRAEHQTLQQRWFAGVHTNIGGGYVNDGLANVALRWMLGEARSAGLGLDWDFLRSYDANPFGQLYNSSKLHWRIIQTLTFRRGKGVRELERSEAAGLSFHPSVFVRLAAGGDELYRPGNLLRYLGSVDVKALLAGIPGLGEDFELPPEVLRAIEETRQEKPPRPR